MLSIKLQPRRQRKEMQIKKNAKKQNMGNSTFKQRDGATTERTEQHKQSNLIIIISGGAPKKGHGWQVEEKE